MGVPPTSTMTETRIPVGFVSNVASAEEPSQSLNSRNAEALNTDDDGSTVLALREALVTEFVCQQLITQAKKLSSAASHAAPTLRQAVIPLERFGYEQRLDELKNIAQEECIPYNPSSELDLLEFLRTRTFKCRRAALTLEDDGSIRATWRTHDWRLSLCFDGYHKVRYVLLDRKRPPLGDMGTVDLDKFDDVRQPFDLKVVLKT